VHVRHRVDTVRIAGSNGVDDVARRMVDHVDRAETTSVVRVLAAADRHDPSTSARGDLHEVAPHATRRANGDHRLALGEPERIGHVQRGDSRGRDRRRHGVIEGGRLVSDGPRRDGGELRQRPLAEVGLADGAEHLITDRVPLDALAQRVHGSRAVHAWNERESVLHLILQVALHHRGVERLQPRRGHPQPELTFDRLRNGEIAHRALLSESIERERLHHSSLLSRVRQAKRRIRIPSLSTTGGILDHRRRG